MKFVAFFRNTNLGRAGSPSRSQLEQAFLKAGAVTADNFQVNGTLVYEARSAQESRVILRMASEALKAEVGLTEPACVRSLATLSRLPWGEVYAGIEPTSVHELTVSFACSNVRALVELSQSTPRNDAIVLWLKSNNALSISRKVMSGPGSPNVLLERLTGVAFTSRSLGTIQRLIARHA